MLKEIMHRRLGVINELAKALNEGEITFAEYIKCSYHSVAYWWHSDCAASHARKAAQHNKWMRDEVAVYDLRSQLADK